MTAADDPAPAAPNPMTSALPAAWLRPALLAALSADSQLYLRCAACGAESRVAVCDVDRTLGGPIDEPCGACGARDRLAPLVHAFLVTRHCRDCGHDARCASPWGVAPSCDACGSANVDDTDEDISPPFPAEIFQIAGGLPPFPARGRAKKVPFAWGRSGVADSQRIEQETRGLEMLPDAARYLASLLSFADRLRLAHRDRPDEERYWIENIVASLAVNLMRRTGDPTYGLRALDSFVVMMSVAPDELNRAVAQHSFAMGCFSLLAVASESTLIAATGDPDFRLRAAAIADQAATTFEAAVTQGVQGAAAQLARIHFVIGDLLRVGHADDEQRRNALAYFRVALQQEDTARILGAGIAQSFAHTVVDLDEPTDDEVNEAVDLLGPTLDADVSDSQHANAWRGQALMSRLLRRQGDWTAALEAAGRAASEALQQFSALTDERLLLKQAETFVPVFEDIACLLAGSGASDDALNAIELSRAASVRIYTMRGPERDAHADDLMRRHLEDLVPTAVRETWGRVIGRASERDFIGFLWDHPIDDAAERVLGRFPGETAAYLSVFISDGIATGIVRVRHADGHHTLDAAQWQPDLATLAWLRQQRYLDPGPFRERLMRKAAAAARDLFIVPVQPVLDAVKPRHLVVSLPGVFSRLPLEAALAAAPEAGGGISPGDIGLSYLPSLRVGADLAAAGDTPTPAADRRVLLIGYGGADLAHQAVEARHLRETWGDRLTVLDGAACTKRSVLDALRQPYDIIHAMCHGTYDANHPMASALHFRADVEDDAHRITAADLLALRTLPRQPLVVLSACSSGLAADSRTNSFHGLPGSLFRLGARAIVGSRWPVDDALTARLMCRLHTSLCTTTGPLDTMLADAVRSLGPALPIEDAAAFGVFGLA